MSAGVLLLRPEHAGDSTDQLELRLRDHGIPVYRLATVTLHPTPPAADTLQQWQQREWDGIIVVSPNAARIFHQQLGEQPWPVGAYYGVGPGTAAEVNALAGRALTYPAREHNSEALLALPELTNVADQQWLCLTASGGRDILPRTLTERGAEVTVAELYERQPVAEPLANMADWRDDVAVIAATSAQQVRLFVEAAQATDADWLAQRHWVVPSNRIADQLRAAGVHEQHITLADSALPEAMSQTVNRVQQQLLDKQQVSSAPAGETVTGTAASPAEATPAPTATTAASAPRRRGRLATAGLWLVVLAVLGGASAGGWWLWQEQQALAAETERRLQDLQDRMATRDDLPEPAETDTEAQEAQWQQWRDDMSAMVNERLSDDRSDQRQQLRDLRDRAAAERDAMQSEIDDQARQLTRVSERLRNLDNEDRSGWYLVEAYDLVTAASHRVWYDHDVEQAVALLNSARDLVARQDDSRYQTLVRQLERDIDLVAALEVTETETIARELQTMQRDVRDLPLRDGAKAGDTLTPAREASSDLSDWRDNLARAWDNFSSEVIRVQRVDEHEIALAADQRSVMLASQELQLQLAQQAAIGRDQDYYEQALTLVATAIERYFDLEDASVQQFQDRLTQLQEQSVEPVSAPSLLSRAMLRDRVDELKADDAGGNGD